MKNPTRRADVFHWVVLIMVVVLATAWRAAAYEGDPAVAGATVSGRVTFTGVLPKPERVSVHRDSKFCGDAASIEKTHVNQASGGIEGVVISLQGIELGKPLSPDKTIITFENRTCRFVPRTNAALVGSTLEIRNTDPILHNTHIRVEDRSGPTVINVVQPAGADVIHKALRTAGFLDIRCDAHTFMRASIHVFDHPYFAVTDDVGRFVMTEVPHGSYRVRIWHEALGVRMKTITVPQSGSLTWDVELSPEE
jgi:hypothetical protein